MKKNSPEKAENVQPEKKPEGRRAQAALFDGLMFLMLVIFAVGMMFTSLNSYTISQDKVMRSAYQINYVQSSMKAIYYLDASTLQNVKSYCQEYKAKCPIPSTDCPEQPTTIARLCDSSGSDSLDTECDRLKDYTGQTTVADLLKLDAADPPGIANYLMVPAGPKLDDFFGNAKQPGRKAARCAMKEIMKPFAFSGYDYFVEVMDPGSCSQATPTAGGALTTTCNDIPIPLIATDKKYISNFIFTKTFDANYTANGKVSCDDVQSDQLLVVRTPFKLMKGATAIIGGIITEDLSAGFSSKNLVLRTCLWPAIREQ